MKSIIKEGDIVLAPFRFLVKAFETEVVLTTEESASAGLTKASKLDFAKRDRIPFCEVKKVLGHISSLSRARIAECFKAAKAAGLID